MRHTPAGTDNASERTLNEYWNADRAVKLSKEWSEHTCPNLEG